MRMKETLNKLSELGLSKYEAKAYLALLQKNPSTAYEIGKASGIPSSKIYEVVNRLSEKGIILMQEEEGKTRYIPQNPEEFLNACKNGIGRIVDSLKIDLQLLNGKREISYVWNILDHDHLADRARRMIAAADKVILLSLWKEEFALLEDELRAAERRGVRIAAVHFGPPSLSIGQVYYHPIEDTLYAEKGGRGLVIVVDSREVLMGNISYEGRTEGAWSRNKGFVTVAEDYVKHDIYIAKILRRFEKELIERFGEKFAKLRDVLHDEENIPAGVRGTGF
jgi:sugar-specific transcriptional regulator TrmB